MGRDGERAMPRLLFLVVDDDKDICDAIELAISLTDNDCETYCNSVEAFRSFQDNPDKYHAIFTDLQMPELNGEELIAKIRKVNTTVPIVMATASRGIFTTEDLIRLNVSSLIAKPFELRDIELAVKIIQEKYITSL